MSFQRFVRPASGAVDDAAPASLGALPVGQGLHGDLVLPLADGEACWIGLDATQAGLNITLAVQLGSGEWLDALRGSAWHEATAEFVAVPDTRRISGYRRAGSGLRVFARDSADALGAGCQRLVFRVQAPAADAAPFELTLRLLDPALFATESGLPLPPPLDLNGAYQGWRLP